MSDSKCLKPGCVGRLYSRGLCYDDYQYAASLVRRGRVDWETLEKAGKCLPSQPKRNSKKSQWIVDGVVVEKTAKQSKFEERKLARGKFGQICEMPPISHWPDRDQEFNWAKSNLCRWMLSQQDMLEWVFQKAKHLDLIVFNPETKLWCGVNHPEAAKIPKKSPERSAQKEKDSDLEEETPPTDKECIACGAKADVVVDGFKFCGKCAPAPKEEQKVDFKEIGKQVFQEGA